MSRLIDTVVKKGLRCVIQNVNHYVGRAVGTRDPIKHVGGEDQKTDVYGKHFSQDKEHQNWRTRNMLSNPFWMGTLVAAGIQVSKIASELWFKRDELLPITVKKPHILNYVIPGSTTYAVTFMRNAPTVSKKVKAFPDNTGDFAKTNVEGEKIDTFEKVLQATDEEMCSMMNRRGAQLADSGEWNEAVKWFSPAAKLGYPPAQFNLALYYHIVKLDIDHAMVLYGKAADKGHREAAYNLSTILIERRSPDWEAAMIKAADLGVIAAQNFLADHYFVNHRYEQSRTYFQKLQLSGDESEVTNYWIGRCHEANGNLLLAELWYHRASRKSNEYGVDAAARLSRLGIVRSSRKITESMSTTVLFKKKDELTVPLAPFYPNNNCSGMPSFFIPSDESFENEINDSHGSEVLPFLSSQNEIPRRSQSFVLCRS